MNIVGEGGSISDHGDICIRTCSPGTKWLTSKPPAISHINCVSRLIPAHACCMLICSRCSRLENLGGRLMEKERESYCAAVLAYLCSYPVSGCGAK
jgi:hypothetical protein